MARVSTTPTVLATGTTVVVMIVFAAISFASSGCVLVSMSAPSSALGGPSQCGAGAGTSCTNEARQETDVAKQTSERPEGREHADRAAELYSRACEAGDLQSCKEVTRFWTQREAEAHKGEISAIDRMTLQTVQGKADTSAEGEAHLQVIRHWQFLEIAAYRKAEKENTPQAWETFLREHPRAPQVDDARDQLLLSELAPVEAEARRTGSLEGLIAFVETHPDYKQAHKVIISFGVDGRPPAELLQLAKLTEKSKDEDFVRFGNLCRDTEASIAFNEAAKLKGAERVAAFNAFIAAHPGTKRAAEAKTLASQTGVEMAITSGSSAAMLKFLEEASPAEPKRPLVRDSLALLLLRVESNEPNSAYEKFIALFPAAPQTPAIRARLADLQKKRTCVAACEGEANKTNRERCCNRCAGTFDGEHCK